MKSKCLNAKTFIADKPGNYIFLIWVLGFVIDLAFELCHLILFRIWDLMLGI
jgi:hypothetical protein